MEIQEILKHIKNVKKSGNGFTGLCPVHNDNINSLSISQAKDGKILIHCHAGCSTEKILAALGLTMPDLFPGEVKQEKKIVAVYQYKDLEGNLVHETVRYEPKSFVQRRPDGKGSYIYKDVFKDIKPLLYNLKAVVEAIKNDKVIYVVEGEKDVDNLGKLGLVATTNPMGAGKWQDHYSDYLVNASVVIVPDNDEPGKQHAQDIAKSLYCKAKSIKIVELPGLPAKGDVTDFFLNIGSKTKGINKLNELVAAASEWTPPQEKSLTICLDSVEVEEVKWLWKPYIPIGKLTLLQGDPGQGKTYLAVNIAAIVSRGGSFPEGESFNKCEPGNVVYQTAEDGLADTLKPRLVQAQADCSRIFVIDESEQTLSLLDERIEKTMQDLKPKLFVIDPLQAYLGGNIDMHRANEVRPVLARLGRLAEKYNCAVIIIMHLSKASQNRHLYRGLGSIDLPAAARSVLLVGSNVNNPQERGIVHIKSSLAPLGDTVGFEIHPEYGFCWKGKSELTADDILGAFRSDSETNALEDAKDFLKTMLQEEQLTAKEVYKMAEVSGFSKRTIDRAKADLKIRSVKIGYGPSGRWIWKLKDCQTYKYINSLATLDRNIENKGFEQTLPMATFDIKIANGNESTSIENKAFHQRLPNNSVPIEDGNLNEEFTELPLPKDLPWKEE